MASTNVRVRADYLTYSHTIGICTMRGRGFYCPVDTAIDRTGRIFVLSRSLDGYLPGVRVTVCGPDSEFYMVFGQGGEGDGEFIWPSSIACDKRGYVYVSDEYLNRISVFDSDGSFVRKWGVKGYSEGQFNGPTGLSVDPDNNLLVADHLNNRIQRFTSTGEYLTQFGAMGTGDGQFNMPWGTAVDSKGEMYVADWRNDRIQQFSPDGEFVASFGSTGQGDGQFNRPSGVDVDSRGFIYVADWGNERVQVLGPTGDYITKVRGESDLSKWAEEFMTANVDEATAREKSDMEPDLPYLVNDPHEESSHIEKLFWGPVSVTLDRAGRLYVTESNRHRLQVYDQSM